MCLTAVLSRLGPFGKGKDDGLATRKRFRYSSYHSSLKKRGNVNFVALGLSPSVESWDNAGVLKWLTAARFSMFVPMFAANGYTGRDLSEMNRKHFGVGGFNTVDVIALLRCVKALKSGKGATASRDVEASFHKALHHFSRQTSATPLLSPNQSVEDSPITLRAIEKRPSVFHMRSVLDESRSQIDAQVAAAQNQLTASKSHRSATLPSPPTSAPCPKPQQAQQGEGEVPTAVGLRHMSQGPAAMFQQYALYQPSPEPRAVHNPPSARVRRTASILLLDSTLGHSVADHEPEAHQPEAMGGNSGVGTEPSMLRAMRATRASTVGGRSPPRPAAASLEDLTVPEVLAASTPIKGRASGIGAPLWIEDLKEYVQGSPELQRSIHRRNSSRSSSRGPSRSSSQRSSRNSRSGISRSGSQRGSRRSHRSVEDSSDSEPEGDEHHPQHLTTPGAKASSLPANATVVQPEPAARGAKTLTPKTQRRLRLRKKKKKKRDTTQVKPVRPTPASGSGAEPGSNSNSDDGEEGGISISQEDQEKLGYLSAKLSAVDKATAFMF